MTLKEKVIKRLRNGFGFDIPINTKWKTNQAHGCYRGMGAHSWYFCDTSIPYHYNVGSCDSVKECLKWKRWVINVEEQEISEYVETQLRWYNTHNYLIENL